MNEKLNIDLPIIVEGKYDKIKILPYATLIYSPQTDSAYSTPRKSLRFSRDLPSAAASFL